MNIFKSFVFHLPKKGTGADQKKSAPAQILNRLRLQPKTLGFNRLRNTGFIKFEVNFKTDFLLNETYFVCVCSP